MRGWQPKLVCNIKKHFHKQIGFVLKWFLFEYVLLLAMPRRADSIISK